MQRACAAALLTKGTTIIENCGNSNDEQAALEIIRSLGAIVHATRDQVVVSSSDRLFRTAYEGKNTIVNVGESGLSMRMFAPIAALYDHEITFTGKGSILSRPMNFFDEHLPSLGVSIASNNGKLPLTIKGPLKPSDITVSGAMSSQFLTGLLFAFAKSCTAPVSIHVKDLQSRPYIDLTLSVLKHFGFNVLNKDYQTFTIHPRSAQLMHSMRYTVEGDWSNAAFLLVAGAIGGNISLSGNDFHSAQGDKNIIDALNDCGALVRIEKDVISVSNAGLRAFRFDATHCPDLFPPLVALASYCEGDTVIKGVHRLLHKESNRGLTLKNEFKRMNVEVELQNDDMIIHGGVPVKGAKVSSNNDHRIAMACAVAALRAKGQTKISGAEAVNKSYPGFYNDLEKVTHQ